MWLRLYKCDYVCTNVITFVQMCSPTQNWPNGNTFFNREQQNLSFSLKPKLLSFKIHSIIGVIWEKLSNFPPNFGEFFFKFWHRSQASSESRHLKIEQDEDDCDDDDDQVRHSAWPDELAKKAPKLCPNPLGPIATRGGLGLIIAGLGHVRASYFGLRLLLAWKK
jgi:hypothetical protein